MRVTNRFELDVYQLLLLVENCWEYDEHNNTKQLILKRLIDEYFFLMSDKYKISFFERMKELESERQNKDYKNKDLRAMALHRFDPENQYVGFEEGTNIPMFAFFYLNKFWIGSDEILDQTKKPFNNFQKTTSRW
jgi:hypothetical protein